MIKGLKLVGLIAFISILNVIVFSPGLIGIQLINASAFQTAFGVSFIIANLLVLLFSMFQLYFKPVKDKPIKQLKTNEDFVLALSRYKNNKVLKEDIITSIEQIERMKKKKVVFYNLLTDRFSPTEITYNKFASVVDEVETLFYLRIRNIINKISTFDELDYKKIKGKDGLRYSKSLIQEKTNLINEYIKFVKRAIELNEEILVNIDKLILEISRLDEIGIDDIEKMECMKEIDTLIQQTKYYRQ
ncbi:hypothetical protein [Gottfriedia acidiceleris]|uniref:5-bromo-4-chloroindolyl phosphate hydrolysis protein n=1 Tax=Gottfriedia acidiceleris TaxID=371036 RepID=A0ABY4JU05_9BACI|nr:hypothetical protein [Gottfriedia acidiceleris]UPM56318.1 hypothetical protein MY490_10995 [Gottfriedia acidiceleris]